MAGGGEWQTVKPNKRVKSQSASGPDFPGSGASSKAPAKELKDSAGAAFAQLDADFSKQNGALKINGQALANFTHCRYGHNSSFYNVYSTIH